MQESDKQVLNPLGMVSSEQLPTEFAKVLHENAWDLMEDGFDMVGVKADNWDDLPKLIDLDCRTCAYCYKKFCYHVGVCNQADMYKAKPTLQFWEKK